MDAIVTVGGEGAGLTLTVAGYARPPAEAGLLDLDWLDGRAELRLGPLVVARPCCFRPDDFLCLAAELDDCTTLLLGSAKFETLEGAVSLEIAMATLGRATIRGRFSLDQGDAEADIRFSFASDQTYLATTLREVRRVVDRFPLRTPRGADGVNGSL